MKKLFDEKMSSGEIQRVFFNYVCKHRGENIDKVKKEYKEISKKIVLRELTEKSKMMTSHF